MPTPAKPPASPVYLNDGPAQPVTGPVPARAHAGPILTLTQLRKWLGGGFEASFPVRQPASNTEVSPTGDSDFSYTVPTALDLLAEIDGTRALVQRLADPGRAQAGDLPRVLARGPIQAQARSQGQALAVEVVALLMAQLAQDSRMLAPVRQLIAGAEPVFRRLALSDPRFFSVKSHPARRFLDQVIHQSLAYASEQSPGFADFMADLYQLIATLAEAPDDAGDAALFSRVLAIFERRQIDRQQPNPQQHGKAVQVLLNAEQRNRLAEKITREIRARPDFQNVSRVVAGFLTGPWAQVMAQQRLSDEAAAATPEKAKFTLVLRELLWSVRMENSPRRRKRLVRVVPEILATLREGLASIEYPPGQSKPFFDALMVLHEQVLKPEHQQPASPEPPTPAQDSGGFQESEPWLAPADVQQFGFLDIEIVSSGMDFSSTLSELPELEGAPDTPQADLVAQLKLGSWVELVQDGLTLRAQLTWASPHHTLFMFSSAGGRTHSMTRRALLRLQQLGTLKGIGDSDEGVVDRALQSVIRKGIGSGGSQQG